MKKKVNNFWDILNQIEDEFMEKGHIFENERSDANAFIQKYKKLSSKIIKTPKTCMFPNCNKESIKRSHTIQNASSLERMAKKGHVFQPVWEDFSSNYQMDKIGVNNASVFTGFCKEHEEIFRNYETKKKMSEKVRFYFCKFIGPYVVK
ncbi:hypothetical protein ACT7CU_00890 [Bacillus paranthracis]